MSINYKFSNLKELKKDCFFENGKVILEKFNIDVSEDVIKQLQKQNYKICKLERYNDSILEAVNDSDWFLKKEKYTICRCKINEEYWSLLDYEYITEDNIEKLFSMNLPETWSVHDDTLKENLWRETFKNIRITKEIATGFVAYFKRWKEYCDENEIKQYKKWKEKVLELEAHE